MCNSLISSDRSHLLFVDVQTKLARIVTNRDELVRNVLMLRTAAQLVEVPLLLSAQYPQGLGGTAGELLENSNDDPALAKMEFSCFANGAIAAALSDSSVKGRDQLIIAGIESHVCVLQTAFDALQGGYQVFVVVDATGSRTENSRQWACRRLEAAGAQIVTTEMVLFEWLRSAEAEHFRPISRLLR